MYYTAVLKHCMKIRYYLGLFQKLSAWGGIFFLDPSIPRTHVESEPPRPPGHVSALINPPHYGSNTP